MPYKFEIEIPDGWYFITAQKSNFVSRRSDREPSPSIRLIVGTSTAPVRQFLIRGMEQSVNSGELVFPDEHHQYACFSPEPFTLYLLTQDQGAQPVVTVIHPQQIINGKLCHG